MHVDVDNHSLYIAILTVGPRPFGSKEIDGLLVPPDKASTLLTVHYYWLTAHV